MSTLAITLAALKICYTAFACVGFWLNILSYRTAVRDLAVIRSTGRNGARLRMGLMFRREEASLAAVLGIIVLIGANSIFTPTPVHTHNTISGIVTGVGWLIIVIILSFNAVANYLARRVIYNKLDMTEMEALGAFQTQRAQQMHEAGLALERASERQGEAAKEQRTAANAIHNAISDHTHKDGD